MGYTLTGLNNIELGDEVYYNNIYNKHRPYHLRQEDFVDHGLTEFYHGYLNNHAGDWIGLSDQFGELTNKETNDRDSDGFARKNQIRYTQREHYTYGVYLHFDTEYTFTTNPSIGSPSLPLPNVSYTVNGNYASFISVIPDPNSNHGYEIKLDQAGLGMKTFTQGELMGYVTFTSTVGNDTKTLIVPINYYSNGLGNVTLSKSIVDTTSDGSIPRMEYRLESWHDWKYFVMNSITYNEAFNIKIRANYAPANNKSVMCELSNNGGHVYGSSLTHYNHWKYLSSGQIGTWVVIATISDPPSGGGTKPPKGEFPI